MAGFPNNSALRSIRELSLGEEGYSIARFLYSDDEAGCAVEVTWRNNATRDHVTYRFRGVVPKELWPIQFGTIDIDNAHLRQWDTPRPLQVTFGELDVQFYASSVERLEQPAARPRE